MWRAAGGECGRPQGSRNISWRLYGHSRLTPNRPKRPDRLQQTPSTPCTGWTKKGEDLFRFSSIKKNKTIIIVLFFLMVLFHNKCSVFFTWRMWATWSHTPASSTFRECTLFMSNQILKGFVKKIKGFHQKFPVEKIFFRCQNFRKIMIENFQNLKISKFS